MPVIQVIKYVLLAFLLAYIYQDATAQGGITLRNRQHVPPFEQPAINADHHVRLASCYALLCLAVAVPMWYWQRQWLWLPLGGLLRFALFDAFVNIRKGDPLFSTGTSAKLDRLLARAPWVNPFLRVAALAGSVAVVVYL